MRTVMYTVLPAVPGGETAMISVVLPSGVFDGPLCHDFARWLPKYTARTPPRRRPWMVTLVPPFAGPPLGTLESTTGCPG